MARIPTPRSFNQIIGDMVDAFLSRFGLKSLKVGSPVLSIMEAAAQSDLRSSQDIFTLLNSNNLDRATGVALDRIGKDEDLERLTEGPASGAVTITDTSFAKIASKIFQGRPAPIVGSSPIYVTDASAFPATGKVYLGRGTSNYEGPLNYTSKTDNGTYWTLNLSDHTRRYHNLGETVILAQGGNRVIDAGTQVQTPQGNTTDAVQFRTLFGSTIPDGEVEISGVQVLAQRPGVGSNVAAGAINAFVTQPFAGAKVTNPLPFTNGQAAEDDKTFRERIRAVRQSRSKGTALALKTAVIGITASDENKRVTSASVVLRQGLPATLYIDDGTGYEERSQGVAVEPLVDLAFGGEQFFQVAAARPVTKAFLLSQNRAPFALRAGDKLALKVGGGIHEHTFNADEFRAISNGSAYEVAASINGNATLGFGASTADAGTRLRLFAKGDTLEDLEVAAPNGNDANEALLFPQGRVDTMRLYRNDRLLSKDGKIATLTSQPPSAWGALTSGETLQVAVDGTAPATYTFIDQDFIDAKTGYTTVGRNSIAAWAKVFEYKIPGISSAEASGLLTMTSNAGTSARAKLQIVGGTLVTPGQMFVAQTVQGADRDYTLDRNTGQIRLEQPLAAGDGLSAGTLSTRAFIESATLAPTTITGGKLWFVADGDAQLVSTGLTSSTTLTLTIQASPSWGQRIRFTASSSIFANVQAGDWMICWDTNLTSMQGAWRVAQTGGTYFEIERMAGTLSGTTAVTLANSGMAFVRSSARVQQVNLSAGSYTARDFSTLVASQLTGASARTYRTNKLRVGTNTFGDTGDIALVAADTQGARLLLGTSNAVPSLDGHLASVLSGNEQAGTPEFTAPYVTTANTTTSITVKAPTLEARGSHLIRGLKGIDESFSTSAPILRYGHNTALASALASASQTGVDVQTLALRTAGGEWLPQDRLYFAAPFALGPDNDFTVVADQDTASKRFTVPMFRRLKPVGSTYGTQNTFSDADNANQSLAASFGLEFDFNDFAVYMRARGKSFASDSTRSVLWRYTRLGPDGNAARVRFVYPDGPNQQVALSTDTRTSKYTNISVKLPSGTVKTGFNLRNTTKVAVATGTGPNGLKVATYCLGYELTNATRSIYLEYADTYAPLASGEFITGTTSGATAFVVEDLENGYVLIESVTGTFVAGENVVGDGGGEQRALLGPQRYEVVAELALPNTVAGYLANLTHHGFEEGDVVYVQSSNPNFPSGPKTLINGYSNISPTTIVYQEAGPATDATDFGTVSFDTGEATFTGGTPAIALGDLMRFAPSSALGSGYVGKTMRISLLTPQTIQGYVEDFTPAVTTLPTWYNLVETSAFEVFNVDAAQATITAIAARINTLAAAENSTSPITAKVLGTGSGTVLLSSADAAGAANTWDALADGVNHIQTTIAPATVGDNYQFTFKRGVAPSLTTDSDWSNEEARLVPLTTKNLVDWLNTLTITGLSTVCSVESAHRAQRLQIASKTPGSTGSVQVQGGTANAASATVSGSALLVTDADASTYALVTVPKSDAEGLFAGIWTSIENSVEMPKAIIQPNTTLTSITTAGVFTFDSATNTPLWSYSTPGPALSKSWVVERQGRYTCYLYDVSKGSAPDFTGAKEGDWVRVSTAATPTAQRRQMASVNQGIYRVVRVISTADVRAFWIENPNTLEETAEADVAFFTFDSIMPGDQLSISTSLWGEDNKGIWTVESVGAVGGTGPQFVNSSAGKNTLKVVATERAPVAVGVSPGALGSTEYRLVQVVESAPTRMIKRIRSIAPNQTNGSFVDILFETSAGYGLIGSTAGSLVKPLDKLGFDASIAQGSDGYSHTVGLIGEANRVIYGDPRDPATYPGVVAAGATVNISSPLIKRVTCGLSIRVRSGVSTTDVADRVRSAVASVINKAGIGQPIAISDIINAASKVNGVVAVAVVSPSYGADNDLIQVQPYEKPLVLNLEQDILVSFAGE